MTDALDLPIHPSGYWLHAHGEGGGEDYDLVMERDDDGLPVLRARHVKGLLRVALERAIKWEWIDTKVIDFRDIPDILLGRRDGKGGAGCLITRDAVVSGPLRAALLDQTDLLNGLFARVASTAIDDDTGTAKPKHLRTIEAGVPIPLVSRLTFDSSKRTDWARGDQERLDAIVAAEAHWRDWIECAWPGFDECGAKRTRGFGELLWTEPQEVTA